jgi:heavy metal sensor kinase
VAAEISAHEMNQRLTVPESNDELARLARTLNGMLDRLHHAFQEVRRFTEDAAHEVRTPLAVIRSAAEIALRSGRSAVEYQRTLESILEETVRLSRLCDQLLFLCREDAGIRTRMHRPVPIAESVRSVASRMQIVAEEKGVNLEVGSLPPSMVDGDEMQLRQLWYNLVDNAIKYTCTGGTVRVHGEPSLHSLRIAIEDSGCGIPSDDLPRVFDRFYRVDKSRAREQGGMGLGLAICKTIVDSHNGAIEVTSQLGQGTRFRVTMPVASTNDAIPREPNSPSDSPPRTQASGFGPHAIGHSSCSPVP